MITLLNNFKSGKHDLFLVLGMIGILVVLFTPIPSYVLDFLLITNFSFALLILLLTFYTEKPLKFSTFPSLLLIATLFRLSLNIAATRLILSDADAGEVIGAVGAYVVGGNYVIGLVVFLILIVVQYVVVTNGAQRVAEVAARFTLDSMPGKQMSIDADMNMGLIDEIEAKERRANIEKEANFYGAMDGSTKFVKGDAIAGIIIILIDIIGGLSIGIVQHGMSWGEALHTFTLLTVGDGIVTQIPSLVIAVATGIIITRAATDSELGSALIQQVAAHPKTLAVVATALFLGMFLPGLPVFPMLILFTVFAVTAYFSYKKLNQAEDETESDDSVVKDNEESNDIYDLLESHSLEIKAGHDLAAYIQQEGAYLLEQIKDVRKNFALDLGFVIPEVKVTEDVKLNNEEYKICIHDIPVSKGQLYIDKILAINPGAVKDKIDGIETKEPAYGLPAVWIDTEKQDIARGNGYTIVEPSTLLITHFTETLKRESYKILTRGEAEKLVERLKPKHQGLIEELIPNVYTYSDIQALLQELLKERVSIRQMEQIMDVLAQMSKHNSGTEELVEKVRQKLGAYIIENLKDKEDVLNVLTLNPELERTLVQQVKQNEGQRLLLVEPRIMDSLMSNVAKSCEKMMAGNKLPVIICTNQLRKPLKNFVERVMPSVTVLGLSEIPETVQIKTFGNIQI
ncbi:flagellar biosynthesis protein FlhA [Pleionea sediminis]|uniref:flagellar biosynthesis protein FlhA n=1 Tax=Pleionea sediminis TaxID=2569479 RepID=UPI00118621E5|nr:flagellar biosynthesis protein FlhA [Pleionea sediminis]